MSVSVGIFTAQMLQDAHLTDIGVQGKQSTPSGAFDAESCLNALFTPRVSKQRSAGASDPYDNADQGEWVRHSGRRSVRAEMRMANCAATSTVARLENAHTPVRFHDTSHTAFCHGATSEGDFDCASSQNTLAPGGTGPYEVARE